MITAAFLMLLLAQDPAGDPAAVPAPAAAAASSPDASVPVAAQAAPKQKGAEEVQRLIKKIPELRGEELKNAIAEIQKQYGRSDYSPILPPEDVDLPRFTTLVPPDQVRVTARHFFNDVLAGDPSGMLSHCGLPFMLEDRRVEKADELRNDWQKSLRGRRTDLLKFYALEVLTPQEMEKKYGQPPRRLQGWNWRSPNTYFAIADLSGHAAVIMLRQVGAAWQVIAYHD
jgi:hypothetical protein